MEILDERKTEGRAYSRGPPDGGRERLLQRPCSSARERRPSRERSLEMPNEKVTADLADERQNGRPTMSTEAPGPGQLGYRTIPLRGIR